MHWVSTLFPRRITLSIKHDVWSIIKWYSDENKSRIKKLTVSSFYSTFVTRNTESVFRISSVNPKCTYIGAVSWHRPGGRHMILNMDKRNKHIYKQAIVTSGCGHWDQRFKPEYRGTPLSVRVRWIAGHVGAILAYANLSIKDWAPNQWTSHTRS